MGTGTHRHTHISLLAPDLFEGGCIAYKAIFCCLAAFEPPCGFFPWIHFGRGFVGSHNRHWRVCIEQKKRSFRPLHKLNIMTTSKGAEFGGRGISKHSTLLTGKTFLRSVSLTLLTSTHPHTDTHTTFKGYYYTRGRVVRHFFLVLFFSREAKQHHAWALLGYYFCRSLF